MKEIAEDFKAIAKKDRNLFAWMAINFLLNLWLFLIPIINMNSGKAKVWARYTDIDSGFGRGYEQFDWWYILSFSLIALALGIGHDLIAARLYTKRGRDLARLFLLITMIAAIIGIRFLLNIIGEG
jgi:hypothetical protein